MAKEQQSVADTMQYELYDPILVAFSNYCYESMNRSKEKKEK